MPSETLDVLVAGNYCHDTLAHPHGTFHALGGSPAYSSAVLSALGSDFEVVAKVGEDFRYDAEVLRKPLRAPGPTTRYFDDFRSGARVSVLEARGAAIDPGDIRRSARVAVASAVAGEVGPETLRELKRRSRLLLCDVQGLVRRFDAEGRVGHVPLSKTPFAALLREIDVLMTSREELPHLDVAALCRVTKLLITEDRDGCRLMDGSRELRLEAWPAKVVDSSGAGDCFLAGFAHGLARGLGYDKALRLANGCGALAVSQVGIPKLQSRDFRPFLEEPETEPALQALVPRLS